MPELHARKLEDVFEETFGSSTRGIPGAPIELAREMFFSGAVTVLRNLGSDEAIGNMDKIVLAMVAEYTEIRRKFMLRQLGRN
jgi:hypothetical protein